MSTLLSPLREFFRKGDLLLLSLCLLASGFGLLLIFSATQYTRSGPLRYIAIQALAILLGVAAYIFLTFVDFQLFAEKNWKFLLAFNILFILLLLTPLGTDHNMGNLNWLDIPGFPVDIQPNEIVKLPLSCCWRFRSPGCRNRAATSAPFHPFFRWADIRYLCWASSPRSAATWACA